jgi:hypothetical protein
MFNQGFMHPLLNNHATGVSAETESKPASSALLLGTAGDVEIPQSVPLAVLEEGEEEGGATCAPEEV